MALTLPIQNSPPYSIGMQPSPSDGKWSEDLRDLTLPVVDEPLPGAQLLPADWVFALNAQTWKTQVLDERYWAESLAGKSTERFVM
jgi:hypothetical protein